MDLAAYFADEPPAMGPMPVLIKGAIRSDLPALFRAWGYRTGVEVGVYQGEYSEELCRGIPDLTLYAVDCWVQFPNAFGHLVPKDIELAYEQAKQRLGRYRRCIFVRQFSPAAAGAFPDGSLDFVYLDGNHWFEDVVADLKAWTPKVRRGGVIAGHDYAERFIKDNRVRTAVTAWTEAHRIRPWYVLGRSKVRPGEPHERWRTWLWRQP